MATKFLLVSDKISAFLLLAWIALLIYTIVLMTREPPKPTDEDFTEKANQFSYVTTLLSLLSFVIYFRFFPFGWKANGTMKTINTIITIITLTFLFMLINKTKSSNTAFETYRTQLIPFAATIFTLAAYSLTGTIGDMFPAKVIGPCPDNSPYCDNNPMFSFGGKGLLYALLEKSAGF